MLDPINQLISFLNGLDCGTVVGLEGYSGIGKTTLCNQIKKVNSKILILHMDDYVVTSNKKENLEPQLDDRFENLNLEWTDVKKDGFEKLKADIIENSDKIVLVEGIFLSHPNVLPHIFDKHIFIDGDENLADSRRIEREKARWGDNYFPESHPDSFARLFKLAWQKYLKLYKPKTTSDLTINLL